MLVSVQQWRTLISQLAEQNHRDSWASQPISSPASLRGRRWMTTSVHRGNVVRSSHESPLQNLLFPYVLSTSVPENPASPKTHCRSLLSPILAIHLRRRPPMHVPPWVPHRLRLGFLFWLLELQKVSSMTTEFCCWCHTQLLADGTGLLQR